NMAIVLCGLDRGARGASSGRVTTFRELAELCEGLARTRSRLELSRRVAAFLGALEPEEVRPAGRLLLGLAGRGEAAATGPTLWRVLLRLVADADGADHAWAGAVDFGEAAERLLARRAVPERALPALSLVDVEARIRALAEPRGQGSRAGKERLLAELV